jgi:hypothetical protein
MGEGESTAVGGVGGLALRRRVGRHCRVGWLRKVQPPLFIRSRALPQVAKQEAQHNPLCCSTPLAHAECLHGGRSAAERRVWALKGPRAPGAEECLQVGSAGGVPAAAGGVPGAKP